jgi:hypothetical protein
MNIPNQQEIEIKDVHNKFDELDEDIKMFTERFDSHTKLSVKSTSCH